MGDKPGRNDPCPCGSGRKYKRCCLEADNAARASRRQSGLDRALDRDADDFDMEALSRDHLTRAGLCVLCATELGVDAMAAHIERCAPQHDAKTGPLSVIVRLHVTAVELPGYWLDFEMRQDAPLGALDRLLRVIWLECCGHLSLFAFDTTDYFSSGHELNAFGDVLDSRRERTMVTRLATALGEGETVFRYEYDFGSTTALRVEVTGHRSGRLGRTRARLLARNEPPVWPCRVCGHAASVICASCRLEGVNPFACSAHADEDMCGEDAFLLPVVNSPRIGTCAYGADPDPYN